MLIVMQWWIALLIVLGVCLVIAILVVIAGKPTLICVHKIMYDYFQWLLTFAVSTALGLKD